MSFSARRSTDIYARKNRNLSSKLYSGFTEIKAPKLVVAAEIRSKLDDSVMLALFTIYFLSIAFVFVYFHKCKKRFFKTLFDMNH